MTHVTLRQLRYFNALARHGHFGRTAEARAISQPALSMRIKDWRKLWAACCSRETPGKSR
jgi:LysR family transcriptional regulator, hydrogen peroxide-inducible genes activator